MFVYYCLKVAIHAEGYQFTKADTAYGLWDLGITPRRRHLCTAGCSVRGAHVREAKYVLYARREKILPPPEMDQKWRGVTENWPEVTENEPEWTESEHKLTESGRKLTESDRKWT